MSDNPEVEFELTKRQRRTVERWSGCLVARVLVTAYGDPGGKPSGDVLTGVLTLELVPSQVEAIEHAFAGEGLTGKEIVFSADGVRDGSSTAKAILKKKLIISQPSSSSPSSSPPSSSPPSDDSQAETCSSTCDD